MRTCLKTITALTKDGEWGKGEPFDSSVEMGVIRGTDFADARVGLLQDVPTRHIPEHIAARKRLEPLDILIETAGGTKDQPTGRTLLVKPSLLGKATRPLTCASFARFIRIDPAKADPQFVFWLLQDLYNSGAIRQYHTQHTGVARFQFTTFAEREPLRLPSLGAQRRIAAFLSAYDDLIENNTRRIKILEEMAQMLYREWFVNFRFPGHERVRMVESELGRIPEGWSVKTLAEIADITMGQSPPSECYNTIGTGLPFHQGVTAFGERFPTDRTYCTAQSRMAEREDILMSVRAPVGRLNISLTKIVIGRGLCAIRSRFDRQRILFQQLKERFQKEDIMGNGTIFKAVTKQDVYGLKLMNADDSTATELERLLKPLFGLLEVLSLKNTNLRTIRDLLLPKLISGEIPVEAADDAGAELMEEAAQRA